MRTATLILGLCLLPGAAWCAPAATSAPAPATRPAATVDDYRVIFERNIFSKDRAPKPPPRRYVPPRRVASKPAEPEFVLTGTALRDEVRLAFFESPSGKVIKVVPGGALGNGKVVSVSKDGVRYSFQGKTSTIPIGGSLSGQAGVDLSARPAEPSATSSVSSGSGSDNDILERMRQRRLKETKP